VGKEVALSAFSDFEISKFIVLHLNPPAYFDKLSTSRWWIAVADFIIYAGSVDHGTEVYRVYNPYIDAKAIKHPRPQEAKRQFPSIDAYCIALSSQSGYKMYSEIEACFL
jgi:hypothetical protein